MAGALGYDGVVERLVDPGQRNPEWPLLTVQLKGWTESSAVGVTYRFSARLATPRVMLPLGLFDGAARPRRSLTDRAAAERVGGDDSNDVFRALFAAIARTDSVAGMSRS